MVLGLLRFWPVAVVTLFAMPAKAQDQATVASAPVARLPSPQEPTLAARHAACDAGQTAVCFALGRTTITGFLVEVEGARINYDSLVRARTGLGGGWSVGVRLGLDFWDWIPVHLGFRHASPNDHSGSAQQVVNCTQELNEDPICDAISHSEPAETEAFFVSAETGLEPNFKLAQSWTLSPGVLVGYAGQTGSYRRYIPSCGNCPEQRLNIRGSAPYVAPSLRLSWLVFGLSLRYERYLAADLRDAISIGFDFGLRHAFSLRREK
jgi:hypothetical protein